LKEKNSVRFKMSLKSVKNKKKYRDWEVVASGRHVGDLSFLVCRWSAQRRRLARIGLGLRLRMRLDLIRSTGLDSLCSS